MLDDRSGINWSLFKVHEYEKGAFVILKAFIKLISKFVYELMANIFRECYEYVENYSFTFRRSFQTKDWVSGTYF